MSRGERIARWLLGRPGLLAAGLLAVAVAGVLVGPRVDFAAGLDLYFDRSSPLQAELDEVESHFVNDDIVFVVCRADDVFTREALLTVRELTERLEAIRVSGRAADGRGDEAVVAEVTSLGNVDDLVGADMSFRTVPLVPDVVPEDRETLDGIRRRALNNPVIAKGLLGPGGRATVLAVRLVEDLDDHAKADTVAAIRRLVAEVAHDAAGLKLDVYGAPVLDADIVAFQKQDLERFLPLVYFLVALVLYAFFRSVRGVLLSLITVGVCLGFGVAILGVLGGSFDNTSVMLPPLLVSLTVAMLVHYHTAYGQAQAAGGGSEAPGRAIGSQIRAVFMASLTTAIGFASLQVSDIPVVGKFGRVAAVALMAATVLVTMAVALVFQRWPADRLISPKGLALADGMVSSLGRLAAALRRYRWAVLGGAFVTTTVLVVGIGRIVVDQNNIEFFRPDTPVRRAYTAMNEEVGGATLVVAAVQAPQGRRFTEPDLLHRLERVEHHLVDDLGAKSVLSILDFVRLMHREFFDGDEKYFRIPDTQEQVAQLLLINGDDTVDEYLDESRRWMRIVARIPKSNAAHVLWTYRHLDRELKTLFPASEGFRVHAVGNSRLSSEMIDNLVRSQVESVGLSAVVIIALMFLMLCSVPLGLHSILPNIFPIVANLGLMGWFGIELDAATVMISTVALGIAVDDTIHFLETFRDSVGESRGADDVVRRVLERKGTSIVATSVIISIGFAVLLASNFAPTRDFALMMSITMVNTLVGDLIILPAMLYAFPVKTAAGGTVQGVESVTAR